MSKCPVVNSVPMPYLPTEMWSEIFSFLCDDDLLAAADACPYWWAVCMGSSSLKKALQRAQEAREQRLFNPLYRRYSKRLSATMRMRQSLEEPSEEEDLLNKEQYKTLPLKKRRCGAKFFYPKEKK